MSRTDGSDPGTSKRLGYLLKHAQLRMAELNDRALAPYGIDGRELGVLLVLTGREPTSQLHVAQRLHIDRTTMVAVLDTLEGKGLVSRHPHVDDRRRNVVELTETGQDTLRRAIEASDEAERELLAPLDPQAARHLREALQAIVIPPDGRS
ncbi:MarR family winged helix-turn-helix transcriptional regulator [Nocardia alni]|uniref:MarR family winged helix-turn-helix transcriptional regulator n=1 Tax=Nocardia alni TaxID=2815723 RepID=UPI001C2222B2|nr:MarR family transcriptional regulator [Nocardia alni]